MLGAAIVAACGSSSSSSTLPPSQAAPASVRYVEGAPELETLINGVPASIGNAYLQDGSETVVSQFAFGSISPFRSVTPGVHSLTARSALGYAVGPLKTATLSSGKQYTLIIVGSYPHYEVLTFAEPASGTSAQLSFYAASPMNPTASFGSFRASSQSQFKTLGSASLGKLVTVGVGKHVRDFGGFVGPASKPIGALKLVEVDAYDTHNVLPFRNGSRLSLLLLDPTSSSQVGTVLGSLDR